MNKEPNLQAMKINAKYALMFKDSLIVLELSDSDIDTMLQTWGTVEGNPLVNNSMVESVIYEMDKSAE